MRSPLPRVILVLLALLSASNAATYLCGTATTTAGAQMAQSAPGSLSSSTTASNATANSRSSSRIFPSPSSVSLNLNCSGNANGVDASAAASARVCFQVCESSRVSIRGQGTLSVQAEGLHFVPRDYGYRLATSGGSPIINFSSVLELENPPVNEEVILAPGFYEFSASMSMSAGSSNVTYGAEFSLNGSIIPVSHPGRKITLRRIADHALTSFGSTDDPNSTPVPTNNPAVLHNQSPLGQGVVADGVTPVLIEFDAGDTTTAARSFPVDFASSSNGGLISNSRALRSSGWTPGANIEVPAGLRYGYAYLTGIDDSSITFPFGFPAEARIDITIQPSDSCTSVSEILRIRRPPVVLVHGYNTDSSTWSERFLDRLYLSRGRDGFVKLLNYGVDHTVSPLQYPNTTAPFTNLAETLSAELSASLVEDMDLELRQQWAYTRYDVIAHI